MDDESKTLLRGIHGRLHIELSEPTEPITQKLANRRATPTATITSLRLAPYVYENDEVRDLSEVELSAVAFGQSEIVMRGLGAPLRHRAPNGAEFTVRNLLAAVEETERATRQDSSWFEGVDIHHIFFEGTYVEADGVWRIGWGS
jgi:hypothetical protein